MSQCNKFWALVAQIFSIKADPTGGWMRFLVRCALAASVILLALIIVVIQYRSIDQGGGPGGQQTEEASNGEDQAIRRLLLAAVPGAASADDSAPAALPAPGPAPPAPGLLLFPVGRVPAPRGPAGEITLNLVIVLIVSLLSIAILITAICCVVIIALALDSSTSASNSSSSSSAEFLLSAWPQLASEYHLLQHQAPAVYHTPGLARLFQQQHNQHCPEGNKFVQQHQQDTPPLTDDDLEVEEDWERNNYDDRQRLVDAADSAGRGWPAAVWNQFTSSNRNKRRNSFTV